MMAPKSHRVVPRNCTKNLPAELLHKNGAPVFSLGGKMYELGSKDG